MSAGVLPQNFEFQVEVWESQAKVSELERTRGDEYFSVLADYHTKWDCACIIDACRLAELSSK